MKFARLAAAPLPFVLIMSHGCSDPPAPPAQAAFLFKVDPAPSLRCNKTNAQLEIPSTESTSVLQELNCDLSIGCKPDDYVVVDRDRGATVNCSVSPLNGNYTVSLSMNVDGSSTGAPSVSFGLTGSLSPTGGTASITENNSVAGGGGAQSDCAVTIQTPRGVIKKGSVWGSFVCDKFIDSTDIGDTGCLMTGTFLFENCSS